MSRGSKMLLSFVRLAERFVKSRRAPAERHYVRLYRRYSPLDAVAVEPLDA